MRNDYEIIEFLKINGLVNYRLKFQVPLSYENKEDNRVIYVAATLTQKYDGSIQHGDLSTKVNLPDDSKLVVFLQGGPGFQCSMPLAIEGFQQQFFDRGYSVLFLDQRGTGYSTPIEVDTLKSLIPQEKGESEDAYCERQMKFILNFRADSIVEDLEIMRKALIGDRKWSLLGQSFGGFCCFTYLSKFQNSLEAVFLTGGIPPIGFGPDDVYQATYRRTRERNIHYYDKYPEDRARVKSVLDYLNEKHVTLPDGGKLSIERFQQLGIGFGASGGTDKIHQLVFKFENDLKLFGKPTYQVLKSIQESYDFDTNIIYALFQEAIYMCSDSTKIEASSWSADRIRYIPENDDFIYSKEKSTVFFTGEMVYKSMFDDYTQLKPLEGLAHKLHKNKTWTQLYDKNVLKGIRWKDVPIVATTYYNDQYVDFELCKAVKDELFPYNSNLKQFVTSEFFHNGLRADPARALGPLFSLLETEID